MSERWVELFRSLPGVVFWVKDHEGVFREANRAFEEFHGLGPRKWVGKTDFDLHPAEVASEYRAEDERVRQLGEVVRDQLWMVPGKDGIPFWWQATKVPLNREGQVWTAGAMHRVTGGGAGDGLSNQIERALQVLHQEYAEAVRSPELAQLSGLSVSQFNRVFKKATGFSPRDYQIRLRIAKARELLRRSDQSISQIALEVGFYDASEFGKRFKQAEGVTPRRYRLGG